MQPQSSEMLILSNEWYGKSIYACKLVLETVGIPLGKAAFCSLGLPEDLQSEILRPSLAESCTNVPFIIKIQEIRLLQPQSWEMQVPAY